MSGPNACEFCGHIPLVMEIIPDPYGGADWHALRCHHCGKINWRIPNPPKIPQENNITPEKSREIREEIERTLDGYTPEDDY